MLNVVTNVQVGEIEGSIIRVGVLSLNEFVMLSNDVHGDWVQAKSENGSQKQIYKSLASEGIEDQGIPSKDDDHIDELHSIWGLVANEIRSNSVEERHSEDIKELS